MFYIYIDKYKMSSLLHKVFGSKNAKIQNYHYDNIEKAVLNNTCYRHVIYTGKYQQLVYMCLIDNEDIPREVHNGDQFIRVEQGTAQVILNDKEIIVLNADDDILIPAGTYHYIKKSSPEDLKLYSLYSPPEHPPDLIQREQPKLNQ